MLKKFIDYIKSNNIARKTDRILLAVSGGIDSMVMAELFRKAGFDTSIAHCNFKLRERDSDEDENFVREYARISGREFFSKSFNTAEYADSKKISVEMAARELRYKWFDDLSNKHGFNFIALAHNRNDNIETMLINLIRGTGVAGLTGMKAVSGKLIRPLLFASRQEIEEYALSESLQWREDKTNQELLFLRNKIRHLIIPLIKGINPSFDFTMIETAERFRELQEILEIYVENIRNKISSKEVGCTVFDIKQLLKCRPFKTVLFELFRPYGLLPGQVPSLVELLEARTGAVLLTSTHRIIKNREELVVTGLPDKYMPEYLIADIEALQNMPFIEKAGIQTLEMDYRIPDDPNIAWLDADEVKFPLLIRKWKHGDRFQPLGMNYFKKLSDYFTDRKLSGYKKEKVLLIETEGKIAWVMGERIDNRFRITERTKRVLIIKLSDEYHDL